MVKFFGRGKERGGAPSAAENSVVQDPSPNGWSHHGKDLSIHGTDGTLHDPLESVVDLMTTMCDKNPDKLDRMLIQQFGENAANIEEVRRRVQEKWKAPPGNSGGVSGLH